MPIPPVGGIRGSPVTCVDVRSAPDLLPYREVNVECRHACALAQHGTFGPRDAGYRPVDGALSSVGASIRDPAEPVLRGAAPLVRRGLRLGCVTSALSPDPAAPQQLRAVGSAVGPVDWYFVALFNFQPDVEVPWEGSSQPFVFHLADIAPALATTVASAQQHILAWIESSGPEHPEPGVRDVLQSGLLESFVGTAQSFTSTADQVQALLSTVSQSGATTQQLAQASSEFATLQQVVDGAVTQVAASQADFADFADTILADVAALGEGGGSVQAAIIGFGAWFQSELAQLQSSPLTIGADLKILEDYAGAYHQSLTTLQAGLQQGIDAARPAAAVMPQIAEQWATLQQTTAHVARQISTASSQSLTSDLTQLEVAAAADEWSSIQQLAETLLATMKAFPIPRPGGN